GSEPVGAAAEHSRRCPMRSASAGSRRLQEDRASTLRRGGPHLDHQHPAGSWNVHLLTGPGGQVDLLVPVPTAHHNVGGVPVRQGAMDRDRGAAEGDLTGLLHEDRAVRALVHHSPIPVITMSLAKVGSLGSTRTSGGLPAFAPCGLARMISPVDSSYPLTW